MGFTRTSLAVALVVGAPALAGGCFALFSLDEYGPSGTADGGELDSNATSDANGADGAVDANKPPRLLFVSSVTFNGSMTGIGGADSRCTALATDAGMDASFVAWLGTGTTNGPASRLANPDRQIVYPNGVVVASNLAELAATGPRSPIVMNERKQPITAKGCAEAIVWTNALANGGVPEGGLDCNGWSSDTAAGLAGQLGGAHDEWTDGCSARPCSTAGHLYCFQK